MESCVAECTNVLIERFNELAKSRATFNLQHWMQFYAFDAIGFITVCQSLFALLCITAIGNVD